METYSHGEWQVMMDIVYSINSAKDNISLRTIFLEKIPALIPHEKSFFDLACKYRTQKIYFDPISLTISEDILKSYYDNFMNIDYANWILNQGDTSQVYRDSDYFTDKLRQQSVLYLDWLKPMGVYYSSGISLMNDGMPYGSLTMLKSEKSEDFSDHDMEIMQELTKHLLLWFTQHYPNGIVYNVHQPLLQEMQVKYMLTPREDEIVKLLYTNTDIKKMSKMLYISESTIRKHIANIYKKMNVSNRSQFIKEVSHFLEKQP